MRSYTVAGASNSCGMIRLKNLAFSVILLTILTGVVNAASSDHCNCGFRSGRKFRIVGGQEAHITRWPWTVFVAHNKTGVFCGASLIAPSWLATVSHCTTRRLFNNLVVVAGENYRDYPRSSTSQVRQVVNVIRHDAYNETSHDNDIALIKVHPPFEFSDAVRPICLPHRHRLIRTRDDYLNNQTGYVTGWGATMTERLASTLQEAALSILSTNACRRKFFHLRPRISENMICTHSKGRDTCKGDSGGPLNWIDPETARSYLVGITSWGKQCAAPDHPALYTKVANYIHWIEGRTGPLCGG